MTAIHIGFQLIIIFIFWLFSYNGMYSCNFLIGELDNILIFFDFINLTSINLKIYHDITKSWSKGQSTVNFWYRMFVMVNYCNWTVSVLLDTRQWYHDTHVLNNEFSLTVSSEYGWFLSPFHLFCKSIIFQIFLNC